MLNSARAVQMSILIVRTFVRLREVLASHKDLSRKIEKLEATQKDHAAVLSIVIKDIQNLGKYVGKEFKKLRSPRRAKPSIGFKVWPAINLRLHFAISHVRLSHLIAASVFTMK